MTISHSGPTCWIETVTTACRGIFAGPKRAVYKWLPVSFNSDILWVIIYLMELFND